MIWDFFVYLLFNETTFRKKNTIIKCDELNIC